MAGVNVKWFDREPILYIQITVHGVEVTPTPGSPRCQWKRQQSIVSPLFHKDLCVTAARHSYVSAGERRGTGTLEITLVLPYQLFKRPKKAGQ